MAQVRSEVSMLLSAAVFAAALPVAAEQNGPGVTDTEITIGQTMPYSGPLSTYGTLGRTQAAYFAKINAEGGINGRKITLISLDDGFNPSRTLDQTRRMVERDGVLLLFSSFGTATNSAIHKYVNAKGVPHLFLSAIATKWGDPVNYPWTMPWIPNFRTEARAYAAYLLREKPNARIAILYQNDDGGKDFLQQFTTALGARAQTMIVAHASYEPSDPSVDPQFLSLKASGADTFMNFAYGKFAAQAIRKADASGWKPMQFVTWASSSIDVTLKSVGFDKANGIYSAAYLKDPTDPQWLDDSAVRDYLEWQRRYLPETNPGDLIPVMGYSSAQTLVHVLRQCGTDLSRKNIMRQAASLSDLSLPMLLPDVRIRTSGQDYLPLEDVRLVRFDGARWVRVSEGSSKRPVAVSRQR